jgi:hypothetical protein
MLPVPTALAVDHFLLVDDFELIAGPYILGEVDVIAEYFGHMHRHAVRQACALAGSRQ